MPYDDQREAWERDKEKMDFQRYQDGMAFEATEIVNLKKMVERYEDALREITKGEGAFSRYRLTHAENVIENLLTIARQALGG